MSPAHAAGWLPESPHTPRPVPDPRPYPPDPPTAQNNPADSATPATRAGIVTLVGKPNAGKSTLLNRLVGQKLSITSDKPQTTRERIVGIRTEGVTQLVLYDTPGLLDPDYPLQSAMRAAALRAISDADVLVYLADAQEGNPPPLAVAAQLPDAAISRVPLVLAFNKMDLLDSAAAQTIVRESQAVHGQERARVVLLSALTGAGVADLITAVEQCLPEGPLLFPPEDVSTQSLRFFAAELVRETALEQLAAEVPYSVACEIEEFREDRSPVYIRAVVYVERESQRRILIGEKGRRIRALGTVARKKIEELVGEQVYLDLWVKVLQNWRRNSTALRRFGYTLPH